MPDETNPLRVAGADGCRGGWAVVLLEAETGETRRAVLPDAAALAGLLASGEVHTLAVDMVLGLPDAAEPGGRACDRAARALLGPRKSSVFSPPTRAALEAATYPEALEAQRTSSPHGIGLSKQAFYLGGKIRALDAARAGLPEALRGRLHEAHPELAFLRLAGRPAAHSKRTHEGRAERLALLASAFPDLAEALPTLATRTCAADDWLDAHALALTALHAAQGRANHLPAPAPRDARGVPMQIVW
jgi:predicted RNase H-like nuclease